jgi:hypothetical protein
VGDIFNLWYEGFGEKSSLPPKEAIISDKNKFPARARR